MNAPAAPVAAQDLSWTQGAARARREKPWFHDKELGDKKSWARNVALVGLLTGGLAPAFVLRTVAWPDFATPHVVGTSLGGLVSGYLLGLLWHRWGRTVLRERGLGAFAVRVVLTGFLWGAFVGGVCGPVAIAITGTGNTWVKPYWEWGLFSGGPSAIAAAFTAAWFAPAFVTLKARGKATWWLHLAWLPLSAFVGGGALVIAGLVMDAFRF